MKRMLVTWKDLVIVFIVILFVFGMFGCRNIKDEQVNSNQPEPKKPKKEKPYEDTIEAAKLFEEFTKNEKEARKKYIGKTFLVTGRISEAFSPKTLVESFGDREKRNFVAGLMLFPETTEAMNNLSKNGGDLSKFPEEMFVSRYEHIIPEQKDESGLVIGEFSHRSKYGGVYCVLPFEYKIEDPSYNKEPIIKKQIKVICRVFDYKKGGNEKVYERDPNKPRDPYATSDDELIQGNYIETIVKTKNRVILTDCEELAPSEN